MAGAVRLAWLVLAACYAQDSAVIDGKRDAKDGALIRGKFYTRTTCAANAAGDLVCFSACNPMAYALNADLSLAKRIPVEGGACSGVVDDAGAVHVNALASAHGTTVTATAKGFTVGAWSRDVGAVRAAAIQPDGGIVVSADQVIAFAPDGREKWRIPGQPDALAIGPGGEVAWAGATLALIAANGALQWQRADGGGSSVATDGHDLFVARGDRVMRVDANRVFWTHQAGGSCAVKARVIGLAPASLLVEFTQTGCEDARDRQRITYGDDALETDGAGMLLARVAR